MQIVEIHAREILDSRGNPTIEVEVGTASGCIRTRSRSERRIDGRARSARAPRRRQGPLPGQGRTERRQECQLEVIAPAIIGMNVADQVGIDKAMIALDGTPTKSKLGANAILGVSLAVCTCRCRTTSACRCGAISAARTRKRCPSR